ncbi:MAG: bifunctional nuclease family protein [Treponemataceae bacterium]
MLSRNIMLSVAGVALDDDGDSPAVLLRDASEEQYVLVPVGAFEASAIIIEIEGIKPPRPLTHDLFAELFSRLGCKFIAFEIYARTDEGFLGRIRYRKMVRTYSMEVRPSDGIALALRLKAPIRMDVELFDSIASAAPPTYSPNSLSGAVLYLDAGSCEERA